MTHFLVLLLALLIPFCLHTGALSSSFSSLGAAYKSYGFSYCFTCSIVDRGVDKPDDYSDEKVETVVDQIEKTPAPAPDPVAEKAHPNVIFIQLESYFDPARIKGLTYAEDPIPNFRALRDSCSNGFLTVPSLGAGTANTEFEVITGMTKAESGRIELHPEPYPSAELGQYIDAVIRPLCAGKNQTVALELSGLPGCVPMLDKLRVNQVLFNLLSNAVKYTPEGGHVCCEVRAAPAGPGRLALRMG